MFLHKLPSGLTGVSAERMFFRVIETDRKFCVCVKCAFTTRRWLHNVLNQAFCHSLTSWKKASEPLFSLNYFFGGKGGVERGAEEDARSVV